MKRQGFLWNGQRGMTLLEVVVTLGILSGVLLGTMKIYSNAYRHFRTRGTLLTLLEDADQIMSTLGGDIRRANAISDSYPPEGQRTVVVALHLTPQASPAPKDMTVVYSRDANHPYRLFRSVYTEEKVITSIELSTHIHDIHVHPKGKRLFEVRLALQESAARKTSSLQVSSAYATRL